MTKEKMMLKKIPFDVHVPNFDGDGIAYTVTIEVQAYTDPETGVDLLTPESGQLIEKTQARHMGLMSAEDIKTLRLRLDLSQNELSELLQIGAKTYTRWESGRAIPSRSMNVMLCAMRDGQLNVNYLRALRAHATAAEWQTRNRCLFLWDFLGSREKPAQSATVVHLSETSRQWLQSWPDSIEPRVLSTIFAQWHGAGKRAQRAALVKALQANLEGITSEQASWPSSPTGRKVFLGPTRPRLDFDLEAENLSS
jgi:DNA-binding transcriptional regulator YiaG